MSLYDGKQALMLVFRFEALAVCSDAKETEYFYFISSLSSFIAINNKLY